MKITFSPWYGLFQWTAAFWSYAINHSILWAILSWFFGPAYIAYRLVHLLVK